MPEVRGLKFATPAGTQIFQCPGLVESPPSREWEHLFKVFTSFGLKGVSVWHGGKTQRPLIVPMFIWHPDKWDTAADRDDALDAIEAKVFSREGTVTFANYSGSITETYTNCVFMGLRVDQLRNDSDHGYFATGSLSFIEVAK